MAIRDNAQKQSCLSMYCAQDPGHPFCEMHFDTDPSDPALKPMPAVPPPGKTSQKQPAAKTKTTPAKPAKAKSAKPCDSCLELPDSTVDPFGRR
jgi:hypothetical protein